MPSPVRLKILARMGLLVVLVYGGLASFLWVTQHRMIYFPRSYPSRIPLPPSVSELAYSTRQGAQRAFYVSSPAPEPLRIWVTFGGNASLALDWLDFVSSRENKTEGFLLIDYPGYGKNQGSASPDSIAESAQGAVRALGEMLARDPEQLRWNVLAHSIGCGPGLEFAAQHQVEQVVLVAPFTSLRAMAQRAVGWPFAWLLRGNFDNRARLADLSKRATPPQITIFHGSDDEVIPVTMSRALAKEFPALIEYHEVAGADHDSIVSEVEPDLWRVIDRGSKAAP